VTVERRRDGGEEVGTGREVSEPGGDPRETGRQSRFERQLFEMKVHAELLRRDLAASGIGQRAMLDARLRFYMFEDDSALAEVMGRLEQYRRRDLN
jgi:hypothetical protein